MWGYIAAGLAGVGALYVGSRKKKGGGLYVVGLQAPAKYPANEFVWRAIALELGWDWDKVTNMATNYASGVNYVNVAFKAGYQAEMPAVGAMYTIAGIPSKVVTAQLQPGNV